LAKKKKKQPYGRGESAHAIQIRRRGVKTDFKWGGENSPKGEICTQEKMGLPKRKRPRRQKRKGTR